jgi:hypothetical protein
VLEHSPTKAASPKILTAWEDLGRVQEENMAQGSKEEDRWRPKKGSRSWKYTTYQS